MIFGLYFIKNYFNLNKKKASEEKEYLPLIYGLSFIFLCVGQLFLAIFNLITEFDPTNWSLNNIYVWKIGVTFQLFGWGFLMILIGKKIIKGADKYIIVVLYFIFYAIGMIMIDIELSTTYVLVAMAFLVYILVAYVYVVAKNIGGIRKKAFYIFFGFIMLFIGTTICAELILNIITSLTSLERIHVYIIAHFIEAGGSCLLYFEIAGKGKD